MLDLSRWSDFQGYGILPGIASARFLTRAPEVVGSRIEVTNRDGSTHIEEIIEWRLDERLRLRMTEFSPPLRRLATSFVETWEFRHVNAGTVVTRSFDLHAASIAAWPVLWIIARLLKKAVSRHLAAMRAA